MKKMTIFISLMICQLTFFHDTLLSFYTNQYTQYSQYNQPSPFNQNYYDPNQFVYPNKTDEEKALSERIEKSFEKDPILAPYASSIQVYTIGNQVTLSGLIDSDRIRLRAESKAKNTMGVKQVINTISVEKTK